MFYLSIHIVVLFSAGWYDSKHRVIPTGAAMIYRDIGKRLQRAREEAQMSQEELAGLLGITQAALSNYELGKRRLYLQNLEQIASILNKPIAYFLEEEPEVETTTPQAGEGTSEINKEILKLISELPDEELETIREFIIWRRDRLK
jgi:transcriptional regulator with XRE-family HTH domain